MIAIWLRGLLRSLPVRLIATALGIALTVALIAALATQIAAGAAAMTRQAVANVGVDWQVQLTPGASVAEVRDAIAKATRYTALRRVWYADVAGFSASQGGSAQTTGPGKAVGLENGYPNSFPAELRYNIGAQDGVLLLQQTAANLHASVGDTITLQRIGLPPVRVRVDGIVAMPDADAFFQAVGLPPNAAPQAPPDNVVLLPEALWHALFDRQAIVRPNSVKEQLHVRLAHDDLPSDPAAAYAVVTQRAHNVEARVAGSAIIGDNIAAKLLGARADALYARVVFLFLGVPGIVLAALLTFAVAASGATRRANERALLRVRGANARQIIAFAAIEAALVGVAGTIAGLVIAWAIVRNGLAARPLLAFAAALIGLCLAFVAIVAPVAAETRSTVAQARAAVGRSGPPPWERLYLDVILLVLAAIAFWQTASTGYQIVLAPEGVPQATVHYDAFLAPLLLWIGAALLAARVWRVVLVRARPSVASALRPAAGRLAPLVAASLSRQHRLITRGALVTGLAFAFGVSTAVFNATYAAQSRVDAQLTNGADVTITGQTSAPPSVALDRLRTIPGVIGATTMLHRFAFVGSDLQDLYGIDPRTIGDAAPLSDAFFANGSAAKTLDALARTPDGILVSEETVQTYQLNVGDPLTLRLQDAVTHRYVPVRFHFVGVAREFPTAPKDSFLVANATYVAAQTHSHGAEIVLLRTQPNAIASVASVARSLVAGIPGAVVTDIEEAQRHVGSSLTAVDLRALTAIELLFALIFVAAATGLMLALGFSERLRTFAVLDALGANARQLAAFLAGEAAAVVVPGALFGVALGFAVAQTLVVVLTGVFDPPPSALTIPWPYLAGLVVAAGAATTLAVVIARRVTERAVVAAVRGL